MKSIIKDLSVIFPIGLIFLWVFAVAIERLVFFSTDLYPDFLVNNTLSLDSEDKMYELIKLTCPQGGADRIERDNVFYLRCGLFWPQSQVTKVYLFKRLGS